MHSSYLRLRALLAAPLGLLLVLGDHHLRLANDARACGNALAVVVREVVFFLLIYSCIDDTRRDSSSQLHSCRSAYYSQNRNQSEEPFLL